MIPYTKIRVYDRKHRLEDEFIPNSYVQGMIGQLYSQMIHDTAFQQKDTSNTLRAIDYTTNALQFVKAAATVVNNGIVVGTGSNAVTISDYALQTLIANGNAAGQLNYGQVSGVQPVVAAGKCSFHITRGITGNAVDEVTSHELGIYCQSYDNSTTRWHCMERTLRDIVFPIGTLKTIDYEIGVTV